MKRRDLFPVAGGLAGLAAMAGAKDVAAGTRDVKFDPFNMSEAMRRRYATRMPTLDRQAAEDFYGSFRLAMASQYGDLEEEVADTLAAQGIKVDPNWDMKTAWEMAMKDPRFAMKQRTWISGQQLMWAAIRDSFHGQMDEVLAELEKYDLMGPGTLELHPEMEIPEYTRYEIHIQPGGFVGDALAGAISAFGSKHFGRGFSYLWNDHEERHLKMAQDMPVPKDGEVRRILDMGTGPGALAAGLKERFPNAEVWGIDVGGPQVRWAHYRAVKLGLDVNYAQRLAEDTKFPDNHFDIVTSYILHHEVTAEATRKIVKEALRVLRPGGVYHPIDYVATGNPAYQAPSKVTAKAMWWQDHRYNNEVWTLQYRHTDFPALMRETGFVNVQAGARRGDPVFSDLTGVKPA